MIRKRSLIEFIVLSLITCGIYSIIFFFCWTNDVNRICQGDGETSPNYIVVLLLTIVTCGLYGVYWIYKQANRLAKIAPQYGLTIVETGGTVLLWYIIGSFLCGIGTLIGTNILIKNLNLLGEAYNRKYESIPDSLNSDMPNSDTLNGGENYSQATSASFCGYCGSKLEKGDQFCASCGKCNKSNNPSGKSIPLAKELTETNIQNIIVGITGLVSVVTFMYYISIDATVFHRYAFFYRWLPFFCVLVFFALVQGNINIKHEYKLLPYAIFCFVELLNVSYLMEMILYQEGFVWQWLDSATKVKIFLFSVVLVVEIAMIILNAFYNEQIKEILANYIPNLTAKKVREMLLYSTFALMALTVIYTVYEFYITYYYHGFWKNFIILFIEVGMIAPLLLFVLWENREKFMTK